MYKTMTIEEIVRATGGRLVGTVSGSFHAVSTDTRTIERDDIFVPLLGKNFDGHTYIDEAFTKGAKLTLANESTTCSTKYPLVYVEDTLSAYGKIAREYIKKFSSKIIAVTGSVGKTTVKEMITEILKKHYKVVATQKNYNNKVGVPQTILSLAQEPNFLILEMGTNSEGEIKALVEIAPPYYSLITAIGNAHLEGFKTVDEVLKEKSHIYYGTRKEGYAFVNLDDARLVGAANAATCKKIFYSMTNPEVLFQIQEASLNGTGWKLKAKLKSDIFGLRLGLLGNHNVYNALAAMTIAYIAGARVEDIKDALEHFKPLPMRGELLTFAKARVLADCYNANPESTKAALDSFKSLIKNSNALVILGDMLELGDSSMRLHEDMGRILADHNFTHSILIGNEMRYTYEILKSEKKSVDYFPSYEEAKPSLEKTIEQFPWVLLKGSRGMRLERVIEDFFKE